MNILATVRSYIGELDRRRRFYHTEKMVRSLPPEVLKDIGWPGVAEGVEQERQTRFH